jgi:hypothetical protein
MKNWEVYMDFFAVTMKGEMRIEGMSQSVSIAGIQTASQN